ncbi:glycosyltransferase family 2 protein [Lachnospiraceae bacterium 62-26]|jgi:Predicted glycosyltransferases
MIGIVILNFNGWDMTMNCIESIRKSCKISYKIYIVDNASTIQMTKKFKLLIDNSYDCELLINQKNRGYSAGNNVGIKRALEDNCEYILISNNDVIFKNESIENLCSYLGKNKNFGIAGPKIYLPSGNIQEINMGCKMTLTGKYKYILRKTPFRRFFQKYVDEFHASKQDLGTPFEVYAVSGCCFMMSRCAARKLFPMDENTFLYEEENIIGIKMEKIGLKTVYNTNSEIIHLGGASTEKISEFAYMCMVESEIYYCLQYLHAFKIQVMPLYIIRTINFIFLYKGEKIREYLQKTCKALWNVKRSTI